MLRVMGCVFIIIGCVGISTSICREGKNRLELLKQIRALYENMKYFITYQKTTIPEALLKLSVREQFFLSSAFSNVYQRIARDNEDFSESWDTCMKEALDHTVLKSQEKKYLLDFPSCLGFMEENAQANALDELLREVVHRIDELESEQKNNHKLVMSLGTAAGVLLSILLL